MAYTTINKSGDFFNTKLYTGNGSVRTETGVGFQPDFTWIKDRTGTNNHEIADAVRGANYQIYPNLTNAQTNAGGHLTAFASDGFTLGTDGAVNTNSSNYVAWNWKAGTGQGSSNTDGSINTTYTSVNTTAGFSISKFTGTGANATVGHGLGVAPSMIIVKNLNIASAWWVYHASLGATKSLNLNATDAEQTVSVIWNNTVPTSSVFSVGTGNEVNGSGNSMIAYCFAEKTGYSKFGSYTGNGNADGAFIYTGFKPAFYIIKNKDAAKSWIIKDNKRPGINVNGSYLLANGSEAEATGSGNVASDEYSNGFKIRGTSSSLNTSGETYIYMAFAEAPLVGTNNIPANAR